MHAPLCSNACSHSTRIVRSHADVHAPVHAQQCMWMQRMRMHATTSCMFVCIHLQVHRDTPPTSVCTRSNECNLQQAYLYTFAQMHAPTCMHLCVHAATHAIVVGEFVCLHVQVCALMCMHLPLHPASHSGNTCFCMHAYTNRCKHLHACLHCQTHTLACISMCMQQDTNAVGAFKYMHLQAQTLI